MKIYSPARPLFLDNPTGTPRQGITCRDVSHRGASLTGVTPARIPRRAHMQRFLGTVRDYGGRAGQHIPHRSLWAETPMGSPPRPSASPSHAIPRCKRHSSPSAWATTRNRDITPRGFVPAHPTVTVPGDHAHEPRAGLSTWRHKAEAWMTAMQERGTPYPMACRPAHVHPHGHSFPAAKVTGRGHEASTGHAISARAWTAAFPFYAASYIKWVFRPHPLEIPCRSVASATFSGQRESKALRRT